MSRGGRLPLTGAKSRNAQAARSLTLELLALREIFGVGDMRSPVGSTFRDGQMSHEVIRTGAVPVFFSVRRVDHITWVECDRRFTTCLDKPPALSDVKGLPAVMGVPSATRSRGEPHRGDVQTGRGQPASDGIDPDVTGECLGRTFARL